MKPDGTNVPVTVEAMYTEEGESVDSAPHPKQVLWIKLSKVPEHYDLLRVKQG
jgi:putative protease